MNYFMLALGLFLGMFVVTIYEEKKIVASIKKIWSFFLLTCYIAIMGVLLWNNWDTISNPPTINNFDELKKILLNTKSNVQLITFGVFFGLAGILSFIIRIPFSNWEQVKFLGFEAKRILENTKEAAREEHSYNKKLEEIRLSIIETISSEDMYEEIKACITGTQFNAQEALRKCIDLISQTYKEKLGISIFTGVVPVVSNSLYKEYLEYLSPTLKETVFSSFEKGRTEMRKETGNSMIAAPVIIGEISDPYFIVYMTSSEYDFESSDEYFVSTISNILNVFVRLLEGDTVDYAEEHMVS
ncbi:hypothetical protein [Brevibacillus sp. MS2.2]|uniref:hypothetical protein n=1 Tax=Brevibacillus sp. MS2.2 TaxID=2738981 RepID=UPI00156B8221|nr:hypothetical protein [Brevibacillus sp. MS2.2]NRR21355.1 hypothetical protein [Brevibacillus sp. MS2.2]